MKRILIKIFLVFSGNIKNKRESIKSQIEDIWNTKKVCTYFWKLLDSLKTKELR